MKIKRLLVWSAPWLWLLLLTDCFFIYLAWLAYPQRFGELIIVMILFTLIVSGLGIVLESYRQRRIQRRLAEFLELPSQTNEQLLTDLYHSLDLTQIRNLGERIRLLELQISELQSENRAYETSIEAWVHEIKNPLSLMELILDNRRDEYSERVGSRLRYVQHQIAEHVDRILFYARLKTAKQDLFFEKIDLAEICSAVLEEFADVLAESRITLNKQLSSATVRADAKTLRFILSQIISNAVKYSQIRPDDRTDAKIDLEIMREHSAQKRVFVRIRDNGCGVAKQDMPFIFDKGFTADHPQRMRATGMGLFLVKQFSDLMSLEILIEDEIEQGFAIRLYFPRIDEVID